MAAESDSAGDADHAPPVLRQMTDRLMSACSLPCRTKFGWSCAISVEHVSRRVDLLTYEVANACFCGLPTRRSSAMLVAISLGFLSVVRPTPYSTTSVPFIPWPVSLL